MFWHLYLPIADALNVNSKPRERGRRDHCGGLLATISTVPFSVKHRWRHWLESIIGSPVHPAQNPLPVKKSNCHSFALNNRPGDYTGAARQRVLPRDSEFPFTDVPHDYIVNFSLAPSPVQRYFHCLQGENCEQRTGKSLCRASNQFFEKLHYSVRSICNCENVFF